MHSLDPSCLTFVAGSSCHSTSPRPSTGMSCFCMGFPGLLDIAALYGSTTSMYACASNSASLLALTAGCMGIWTCPKRPHCYYAHGLQVDRFTCHPFGLTYGKYQETQHRCLRETFHWLYICATEHVACCTGIPVSSYAGERAGSSGGVAAPGTSSGSALPTCSLCQ